MQEQNKPNSDAFQQDLSHQNSLVAAANPLINAIPQIRHSVSHDDPARLRQQLIDQIRRFELACQQS